METLATAADAPSTRTVRHAARLSSPTTGRRRRAVQGGSAGFETGHRDAERRAGDVVEAGFVEEVDAVGVAAVLATDAELEIRLGGAAAVDAGTDQRTDTFPVDRLERRRREDALLQVAGEEGAL